MRLFNPKSNSKWVALIKEWMLFTSISLLVGFSVGIILGGIKSLEWHNLLLTVLISLFIGLPIWKGNEAISKYVDRRIDWNKNPRKAFRLNLILTTINNVIFLFFIISTIYYVLSEGKINWQNGLGVILINTFIVSVFSFLIWAIFLIKKFFTRFTEQIKAEERYKMEIATFQYEMLKNQINPHFLFNSLNVLISLIESNKSQAIEFTAKLAELYRYVLDVKDKEKVPLLRELKIVNAYLYMQKQRFGSSLEVTIGDITDSRFIVPLALQMVVENALKHNIATTLLPLKINIEIESNFLICTNNLQIKETTLSSNSIGLKNISERYKYLSEIPVEYFQTDNSFVVKLPLIR